MEVDGVQVEAPAAVPEERPEDPLNQIAEVSDLCM